MTEPPAAPAAASAPFRRERVLVVILLALVGLSLALAGGLWVGASLAQAGSREHRLAQNPDSASPATGPRWQKSGKDQVWGPGIEWDPDAFPGERFIPAPREPDPEETGEGEAEIIGESGDGSRPVNLLGGDTEEGDSPFFNAPPPARPDPSSLFDLGAPPEPPTPAEDTTAGQSFLIRFGAFESRANADQLVRRLQEAGFSATLSESTRDDGTVIFRVNGGVFSTKADGEARLEQLRAKGFSEAALVPR